MSKAKKKWGVIHYLPIYGCIATGIIYVAIGVIAILSFLKIRKGGADESSLLAVLNDYIIGKVLIWIILLGTLSYIMWRIYETVSDPYGYGKGVKGITKRTGIALSTIADVLIVYAATRILLGVSNVQVDGQPTEEREAVGNILMHGWGRGAVIGIGSVIIITSLIQLLYGVTRGYKERVDMDQFRPIVIKLIHFFAWVGYVSRGIILGITGFLFIKAGALENSRYVVNTDKAFDFIGDDVGHVYFIVVAIGTTCYGIFMFALGVTYDSDKD